MNPSHQQHAEHGDRAPDDATPARTGAGAAELGQLRDLVRDHEVCWESRPEYAAGGESLRPVGFVVDVSATHHEPHRTPVAGCPECEAPFDVLRRVVDFILPREPRDSIYDVHIRGGSMRYDRRRGNRPEVVATVLIEHGAGADLPIDACERRCLEDIASRLKQLGACEGEWRRAPPA